MNAETRFCDQCGTPIPRLQSRFCASCGADIPAPGDGPPTERTRHPVINEPANQAHSQTPQQEQILRQFIHEQMASSGLPWNLVSSEGNTAILGRKKSVNHILHFLLSLFTAGFWILIWIILTISRKEERRIVEIDLDEAKIITKGTGLLTQLDENKWDIVIDNGTVSFKYDRWGSM